MKRWFNWFVVLAAAATAHAQGPAQVRRATFGDSRGDSGKCTVEVRVDIAAEVDIFGDSGRLRTLAGQPASWVRLECSDPLPRRVRDFRFSGVDGRGRQQLFKDPRGNNSVAVIRIDDSQGGAENYTFDIEWSGGSGGYASNGFGAAPPMRADPPPPPRREPPRISAERAMDLCRAEVHARARESGLRDIDVTSIGVETVQGRANWISGAFSEGDFSPLRGSPYRFNCAVDYVSGRVAEVQLLRADGAPLRSGRPGDRR